MRHLPAYTHHVAFDHLSPQARSHAEPALADVVRAAWQLDSAGDTGNAEDVTRAFAVFTQAVSRLIAAFSETQP